MAATACSEVAEGILLYMSLQLNHLSRNSVKQLNPKLTLQVGLPTGKERESSEAPPRECQVQILASGLGCYYLDGTSFLNILCQHGTSFRRCLCSSAITDIQLLCRCIGEHNVVTCYGINAPTTVQETVIPRPEHFNPATILTTFKVNVLEEYELTKLLSQLHLMHITNPEIGLKCIDVRPSCGLKHDLHIEAESFKQFTRTRIKLATSLRHFYSNYSSLSARLSKLHLLKGDAYTIPTCVTLASGAKVTLKVHCTAAVVPHLALRNSRKIPANRLCKHVHISVFGPSHLPLVVAGSEPNFPLSSLAEWDSYGMELKTCHLTSESQDHALVIPSYICEVSNTRVMPSSGASHSTSSMHHLELFIFLEDANHQEKSGLGKNSQWKHHIELHHKLRGTFQSLAVHHSKKFHQAVHSALNKLICNYGSHAKTKSIMATAIPLISDAVASIIKHSTNDHFKESCRDLMQVGAGEPAVGNWVTEKLWKMAKDKLGAAPPSESSTPNPDEPTSPELILAAGESSNSEPPTQTSAESASDSHVERNDTNSLTINQVHVVPGSYTSSQEETQSGLFQARIASNVHVAEAGVSQQAQLDNYDLNEDVDFEALSSFDDTALEESGSRDLDSDETAVSDFDALEGVGEGELSFSDEPPSPPMLTTKALLPRLRYSHSALAEARDNSSIHTESMDTEEMDDFGELSCVSDGDDITTSYPMNSQITTEQARLHSLCAQKGMVAALPSQQHIPGTPEQAKMHDHSDDNMSCLSDKEWTELSFTSPLFLHSGKGQSLPAVECWTTQVQTEGHECELLPQYTNSHREHTLDEDDTVCSNLLVTYTPPLAHGSISLRGDSQMQVRTPTLEDVWCKDHSDALQGFMTKISNSEDASMMCDVTDDDITCDDVTDGDFCWDSHSAVN